MAADDAVNVGEGVIPVHPNLDDAALAATEAKLKAALGAAGEDVRVKLSENISRGLTDSKNFEGVDAAMKRTLPQVFENAGGDSSRAFHRGFFAPLLNQFNSSGNDAGRAFKSGFLAPIEEIGNDSSGGGGGRSIWGRIFGGAESAGKDSGRSFATAMRASTTSVFGEATGFFGFLTSPIGIAVAAGAGVALGGALASAVTSAFGLSAIGLAFLALHNDPNIKIGLSAIGQTVIEEGKKLSEPFRQPFIEALDTINQALLRNLPTLAGAMAELAKAVQPLAAGFAGFIDQIMPGFESALRNAAPIVAQFGKELPGLGKAIGDFFKIISESQGQVDGLRVLFKILEGIIYGLAYTIQGLATTFNGLVIAGRAVFNWYNTAFLPFFWGLVHFFEGPFIAPFLAIANFFQGSFLTPFKTLVSFFEGSFLFPFKLIASFFTGSFLTPFRAIGDFFQGSFLTPFKTVESFFTGSFLTPFHAVANFFSGPFLTPFHAVADFFTGPFAGAFVATAGAIKVAFDVLLRDVLIPFGEAFQFVGRLFVDAGKFIFAAWEISFGGLLKFIILPTIDAIVGAFNALVAILAPLMERAARGFDKVVDAVLSLYNITIKPTVDAIVLAFEIGWNTIAGTASRVWDTITQSVSIGIATLVSGITSGISGVVGLVTGFAGGVATAWNAVWGAATSFFTEKWHEMTAAVGIGIATIGAYISGGLATVVGIWNTSWAVVANFLHDRLNDIREGVRVTFDIIKGFFTGHKNDVTGIWSHLWGDVKDTAVKVFNDVKDKIQVVLDQITHGFDVAKTGIKKIWDGIQDVVKVPVNFVIDPIYEKGIRKVFNTIAEKAGISERLPKVDTFAEGGPIHGPGGPKDDKVPIWASPGEYVINAASTAKFLPLIRAINNNQQSKTDHFWPGGIIGDITDAIGNGAKSVGHFTRGLLSGAAGLAFKPVRALINSLPGAGIVRDGAVGLGNKAVDGILEWIRGDDARHFIPDGLAMSGVGDNSVAAIIELASRSHIPYNVTSTVRSAPQPGQNADYHMTGNAVDFASDPGNMNRLADYFMKYAVDMLELIHSPSWFVKKGRNVGPGFYGPDIVAQHYNHVHAAMTNLGVQAAEGKLGRQTGFAGNAVFAGAASLGQIEAWINQARSYVPIEWMQGLETLILRESAGNPNSRNLSDWNAQQGDPSVGLMQVIGSTFEQYRDRRLPDVSTNPISNIVAGMNYIHNRYGSLFNVQQAHAELPPHGYRAGGLVKLFDRGGTLDPGMNLIMNGTGKKEKLRPVDSDSPGVTVNVYVQDERLRDLIKVEVEDSHNELSSVISSGRRGGQ